MKYVLFAVMVLFLVACGDEEPVGTPVAEAAATNTTIPRETVTLTPPPTATGTPTLEPTMTDTPTPLPTSTPVPTDTPTPTATPVDPQQLAQEAQQRLRQAESFYLRSEHIVHVEGEQPYIFKEQCRWQQPDKLHCFQIFIEDPESFQLRTVEFFTADGSTWTNTTTPQFAPESQSTAGGFGSDPAVFEIFDNRLMLFKETPDWIAAPAEFLEITNTSPPFFLHDVHTAEGATQGINSFVGGVSTYKIEFPVPLDLITQFTNGPFYDLLTYTPLLLEHAQATLWVGVDDLLPRRISYLVLEGGNSMEWVFEYEAYGEEYAFPEVSE